MTSIVTQAWRAAGEPEPMWQGKARHPRAVPSSRAGVCALTGERGEVFDSRHVLSDTFSAWDLLPHRTADPKGLAFSTPAAWAFRLRPATYQPHALAIGRFGETSPLALLQLLLRPLARDQFVTVPQSRHKHLLPFVEGGCVRVDHQSLRWDDCTAQRLSKFAWLRGLGFSPKAIAEPAPRWHVFSHLTQNNAELAQTWWPELVPWRANPAYLDVAAAATRPPKKEQPDE